MRLWTLHPKYLDARGIVALWREALLARAVLRGMTRGYTRHPQLERFKGHVAPRSAINAFLAEVHRESQRRGYTFDEAKVGPVRTPCRIEATTGQLEHEWEHLMRKLRARSRDDYRRWSREEAPEAHPIFKVIEGPISPWERT